MLRAIVGRAISRRKASIIADPPAGFVPVASASNAAEIFLSCALRALISRSRSRLGSAGLVPFARIEELRGFGVIVRSERRTPLEVSRESDVETLKAVSRPRRFAGREVW